MQRRLRGLASLLGLGALALAGCDKPGSPHPATSAGPRPVESEPAAPAARCELAPLPLRLAAAERVVAIGDVHGDLAATRRALRLAGAIDDRDRWVGGRLVVVQTGDQLDRGDDEPEILALFAGLAGEAEAAGGAFVQLLGNHELMNAAGDLRYVTTDGYRDYGGKVARVAAFRPAGPQARLMARYRTVVIVGDTLFVHGGIEERHVAGLAEFNTQVRCWLSGAGSAPAGMEASDGPVWSRAYSRPPERCDALARVLGKLGVSRMVVGHTPQRHINAACNGQVWRIDVGLAAHYGGPTEVLELRGDKLRILR